jgi:hypothetical protein
MAISNGFEYTTSSATSATITDYFPTISTQSYSVTVPSTLDGYNVIQIDTSAFSGKSLSEVTLENVVDLKSACFANNSGLSVTIDENITTDTLTIVNTPPFNNCAIGDNLTITTNVTNLDKYIFRTSGLTSVSIPSTVIVIDSLAFQGNSISSLNLDHDLDLGIDCFGDNTGISVVIDADITTNNLTVVTNPPFDNCDINDGLTVTDNVSDLGNYIFRNCGITTITLPSSLNSIGVYALSNNSDLADVYFYNQATIIGSSLLDGSMSDITPGVIHGYADSTAETYANSISNYTFSAFPNLGIFNVGQYVKIKLNDELRFTGIINDCSYYRDKESIQLKQQVSCVNLNNIPARRTIKMNYSADTTASVVVRDMVDDYLSQEGIEQGQIDDGVVFEEEWINDVTNIAEVLDECSNRSGFQWFIDNDMKLNFYKNPTTVSSCTYSLDTSTFEDFRMINVNENIDNYTNKLFVVGGNDDHGDLIYTINGDIDKQNEIQNYCAGTGVYGVINRDSAIVGHEYKLIESGSGPTTVIWTNHPMAVNDFFWNVTRDIYSIVTEISTNSFTCESVASQASGDTIEAYVEANTTGRNMLSRQSEIPRKISFHSYATEFYPGTKLTVSVSNMSLSGVYCIDEVSISEKGACIWDVNINAVRRISTDFNTQKNLDYTDYFRGF